MSSMTKSNRYATKIFYKEIIRLCKGLSDKHQIGNKIRIEASKITCKFHAKWLLENKGNKITQTK